MKIFKTLAAWRLQARTRAILMALDDHALKDIGLKRADVAMESDGSFWRRVPQSSTRANGFVHADRRPDSG